MTTHKPEIARIEPYYVDDLVTLYCGKFEDVLPTLGQFDACVADPPYGQSSLAWDKWPTGWVDLVEEHTKSLWCFGTMRMFFDHREEFARWKFAQDVIWEKTRATSVDTSRFRRRHEILTHWYRGKWADITHDLPKVPRATGPARSSVYAGTGGSAGTAGERVYSYGDSPTGWVDDGTRYLTSILEAATVPTFVRAKYAINATQKPIQLLEPLIQYTVPLGGTVLDPFAGSGSTGIAARNLGRRAVLIEVREEQCQAAAKRLAQTDLFGGARA
jgi:site-specific DNA-methyltransferase (adenine-specific)